MKFKKIIAIFMTTLLMSSCDFSDITHPDTWGHNYATEWSWDKTNHWHQCIDVEHPELTKDNAAHEYEKTVVEPTTSNYGYTEYKCKVCGYSYQDDKVDPLNIKIQFKDYDGTIFYEEDIYNYSNHNAEPYYLTAEKYVTPYIIENNKVRDFMGWSPYIETIKDSVVFTPVYGEPQDYHLTYNRYDDFMKKKNYYYVNGVENVLNKDELNVVIPESRVDGEITEIDGGFHDNINIKSVTLSKNITSINSGAFSNCKCLTKINLNEGLTNISSYAFENCIGLKEITIPEGVEIISKFAFSGCENLEKITLSKNNKSIGEKAFKDCISLKEIYIPDATFYMGYNVFSGCTSLSRVRMSMKLENLDVGMFRNCVSLRSIYLPKTVNWIYPYAFAGTNNLTIYCEGSEKNIHWETYWDDGATNIQRVYDCADSDKYNPYDGD